jgi:2-dehydro-3-deoxygalactonokinase
MRGEETQLAGALARQPGHADATFILPGTHSKWVRVRDGVVVAFRTLMTGELYAVLRQHSILGAGGTEGVDSPDAFARGVAAARDSGTAGAFSRLFSARALMLDGVLAPAAVPDYLSGLLLGEEFRIGLAAGLARRGMPMQLIGDPALCGRYRRAAVHFDIDLAAPLEDAAAYGLWRLAVQAGLVHTDSEVSPAC